MTIKIIKSKSLFWYDSEGCCNLRVFMVSNKLIYTVFITGDRIQIFTGDVWPIKNKYRFSDFIFLKNDKYKLYDSVNNNKIKESKIIDEIINITTIRNNQIKQAIENANKIKQDKINNYKIKFLDDSTHELAGKTLELLEII